MVKRETENQRERERARQRQRQIETETDRECIQYLMTYVINIRYDVILRLLPDVTDIKRIQLEDDEIDCFVAEEELKST